MVNRRTEAIVDKKISEMKIPVPGVTEIAKLQKIPMKDNLSVVVNWKTPGYVQLHREEANQEVIVGQSLNVTEGISLLEVQGKFLVINYNTKTVTISGVEEIIPYKIREITATRSMDLPHTMAIW